MEFEDLDLNNGILRSLRELNYLNLTNVQEKIIPILLNYNELNNLLVIAQTGTGKTGAYLVPILDNLIKIKNNNQSNLGLKVVVLAPTRELVSQIYNSGLDFSRYLNLNIAHSHGGFEIETQITELNKSEILISTPKRFLDLIKNKLINLNNLEYFVIDEFDVILEQDIKGNLKEIFKLIPKNRNNYFFSASISKKVEEILKNYFKNKKFEKIEIEKEKVNFNLIKQFVYYVKKENKFKLLLDILNEKNNNKKLIKNALIFLNDKKDIDNLVRFLRNNGIESFAFHSAKSNVHREKALNNFKLGKIKYLIATDIASRGLDIENLKYVINFDIPLKTEDYIHRVGRVGRADIEGIALNFCSEREKNQLEKIEKLIGNNLKLKSHKYHHQKALIVKGEESKPRSKSKKNNRKKINGKKIIRGDEIKSWLEKMENN